MNNKFSFVFGSTTGAGWTGMPESKSFDLGWTGMRQSINGGLSQEPVDEQDLLHYIHNGPVV